MKAQRWMTMVLTLVGLAASPCLKGADEKIPEKPYPLSTCIVTLAPLGEKPVVLNHEGQEMQFCCKECVAKFKASPDAYLAKMDTAAKESAKKNPYPLSTCLVSGEKLDSMGKPYVFVYRDREIKLCCKACLKKFQKNPAKYMDLLPSQKK